jgi:phage baseplate assembly protein W
MPANDDIIGIGFAFPMGVDGRGGLRMTSGPIGIEEDIRIILGTGRGERRMRPEFGCAIHEYVFDPMDATTTGLIRYHVTEALKRWEPRIDLQTVYVRPDAAQDGCLLIEVAYTVRSTGDKRNLVYPFYTIPREE